MQLYRAALLRLLAYVVIIEYHMHARCKTTTSDYHDRNYYNLLTAAIADTAAAPTVLIHAR
jgi:hypothetical protein